MPHLRGEQVFICEPRRVLLTLGNFFSIMEYDEEIMIVDDTDSITNVLWNPRNPFDLEANPYAAWHEEKQSEKAYQIEEMKEEYIDVLKHANKIQVQV